LLLTSNFFPCCFLYAVYFLSDRSHDRQTNSHLKYYTHKTD